MNIDRLRAVQADERDADSLHPLPDEFYRDVADYLDELRERRTAAAESAADPFGAEDVRRLTDEIETAEEVAEAIYERRVGKLVKRASLAAAGMPADEEGLTAEEAELFADLVTQIEEHREAVLESFSAGSGGNVPVRSDVDADREVPGDAGPPDPPADEPDVSPSGPSADPEPSPPDADEPEAADPANEGSEEPERVTVRITQDVGEVFGVDERVYDLAAEDVVTLPTANARPLLERDAAEPIE